MSKKGFLNTAALTLIISLFVLGIGYFIISKTPSNDDRPESVTSKNSQDVMREKYAEAQKKYQNDLYTFFVSRWPDLRTIIEINRDLQLALIDSRTMKFYYLLEHSPDKIIRNEGVFTFANFDWTDTDNDELKAANPIFTKLEDRINDLRMSGDGHPMWPEFGSRVKNVANDNTYLSITNSLNQDVAEVEAMLGN